MQPGSEQAVQPVPLEAQLHMGLNTAKLPAKTGQGGIARGRAALWDQLGQGGGNFRLFRRGRHVVHARSIWLTWERDRVGIPRVHHEFSHSATLVAR